MKYYALQYNQVGLEDIQYLGVCPDDDDPYEYFEKALEDLAEPMYGYPQLWDEYELEDMIKQIQEKIEEVNDG